MVESQIWKRLQDVFQSSAFSLGTNRILTFLTDLHRIIELACLGRDLKFQHSSNVFTKTFCDTDFTDLTDVSTVLVGMNLFLDM